MGHQNSRPSQIYYGKSFVGPIPLHLEKFELDPDLLEFLQNIHIYSAQENELEDLGYDKCIDYPDILSHIYYEGYFHTLPTHHFFKSMHSRKGHDFDKPRAPLEMVAFCEATRRRNRAWADALKSSLSEISGPAAEIYHRIISENRHFADCSVQLHFGAEIPPSRTAFHVDGPNSAIHLAVSIRGERSLFWKGSTDPSVVLREMGCTDAKSLKRNIFSSRACYETKEVLQRAGKTYLSSPFVFSHGVCFPESTYDERTLAVQCRCLFSAAEYDQLRETTEEQWHQTMGAITTSLREACHGSEGGGGGAFGMPSLEEVRDVLRELEATAVIAG